MQKVDSISKTGEIVDFHRQYFLYTMCVSSLRKCINIDCKSLRGSGWGAIFLHPLTEYLQQYSLNSNQRHTECKASEVIYFSINHKSIVTSLFAKVASQISNVRQKNSKSENYRNTRRAYIQYQQIYQHKIPIVCALIIPTIPSLSWPLYKRGNVKAINSLFFSSFGGIVWSRL